jgi:hypothetical protein
LPEPTLELVFASSVGVNLDEVLDGHVKRSALIDCFQFGRCVTQFRGVAVVDHEHRIQPGTKVIISAFGVVTKKGITEICVEYGVQLRKAPEQALDGLTLSLTMLGEAIEHELRRLGLRPVRYSS